MRLHGDHCEDIFCMGCYEPEPASRRVEPAPQTIIPMIMWCPQCGMRHVDGGEFATKPHHTHACQNCGFVWRPAIVQTVGVQFLPGFKDNQ